MSTNSRPAITTLRRWKVLPALSVFVIVFSVFPLQSQVAVTTYHNDNARTGQNAGETLLTPANVNVDNFGRLFSCDITPDGGGPNAYVYAEPLYLPNVLIAGVSHNVVYVATERNQIFAFDADANPCQVLWQKTFEPAISPNASQDYLAESIGIQSTPVIDTNTGTLYFVSATGSDGTNQHMLHAIDISTGADKLGGPIAIAGSVAGSGDGGTVDTFDPNLQNQRPALLLANGNIYISWGSYDDNGQDTVPSYHGWVMAYDAATLQLKAIFNTTPNGHAGSAWALGALAADSSGNIYVGAGNGNSNCVSNCDDTDAAHSNFAHAYMRLNGTTLTLQDYFIPFDWHQQTLDDQDVNGGGALLLPDQPGAHPHLLVWGTKSGKIYLLDRDNMGKLSTTGSDSQIVQSFQAWSASSCAGDDASCVRTLPTYWNGNVYFLAQNHGLQIYSLTNGLLSTMPTSEDTTVMYPLRGSPVSISANGHSNGIAWAVNNPGGGLPSTLYAYDASNAANILYTSDQNGTRDGLDNAQNFTSAMVADGKVFVATRNNLHVFGLLKGDSSGLLFSPSSLTFSSQQVGTSSAGQSVTLTNNGGSTVTLNGITASGDFAQTNTCGASLAAGSNCNITVTFAPTQTGARSGAVSVSDSAAGSPHTLALSGTGTTPTSSCVAPSAPGVVVCAPSDGATVTSPVNFVAQATPASGEVISAAYVYLDDVAVFKQVSSATTVNINVTVANGTHVIRTQVWDTSGALYKAGSTINVVTSITPASVTLSPSNLTFPSQAVGTSSTAQVVKLTNSGGSTLTLSGIGASGDFSQSNTCGSSLTGGASCNISVVFTPSQTGTRTGVITVTDSASGSPHSVSLSGTGATATPAAVSLNPSSLTFASQQTGTTSATQSVTLTNSGGSTLTLSGITASGDFAQTNACGTSLNAGASCSIAVTFTPTQTGTRTGAITITDSGAGSPHTVSLTGTGTTASACSAPASPGVVVCSPANGATVSSPVNFIAKATPASGVAISAMYVYLDDVAVFKQVSSSNTVNVNVTVSNGTHVIRTQVWDDSGALYKAGSTITVGSSGSGAAVSLSPGSLTFGSQQVGTTSATQSVTLSNSGRASLTLSGIAASGDFVQTNNCPSTLGAGANCNINVTFSPTQAGTRTGAITITDSASGSPHSVSLTGTGTTTTSGCSAPSAPGVVVCSPSDGATVASPVNFVAKATPASGVSISAMYVYLDDIAVFKQVSSSNTVNVNVAVGSGTHVIRTQVWDDSGALYKAGSTITVP